MFCYVLVQNLSGNVRGQALKERQAWKLAENELGALEREKCRLNNAVEQHLQRKERHQVKRKFGDLSLMDDPQVRWSVI